MIDNQVRSLRKRQVIAGFQGKAGDPNARKGAYWGIGTAYEDYAGRSATLICPANRIDVLAKVPTRLKRVDDVLQQQLINWGYAVCDAALRTYVDPKLTEPAGFPYPAAAI